MKPSETSAKGDLQMLKCAAVHPGVSSAFWWKPLATLFSPVSAWLLGMPCPSVTAHSPFELVAWLVL